MCTIIGQFKTCPGLVRSLLGFFFDEMISEPFFDFFHIIIMEYEAGAKLPDGSLTKPVNAFMSEPFTELTISHSVEVGIQKCSGINRERKRSNLCVSEKKIDGCFY